MTPFIQNKKNKPLQSSALILLIFALLIPLLGLPAFRYGWYTQIESLTGALWILGAGSLIWNFVFFKEKPRLAQRIYSLPVVWGWVPLIGLSFLTALFQPAPLQSFTSNPQLSDGILTALSLFALSPPFIVVTRRRLTNFLKILLLGIPTIAIGISSVLTILGALNTPVPSLLFWKWAPMFFPDYLTYYIISLGVIYVWLRPRLQTPYALDIFYGFFLFALTYYAKNNTIILGITLAAFTLVILKSPLKLFWFQKPYGQRLAYCAGLGLMTLTILICATNFIDDLPNIFSSIISRAHISQFTFLNYLSASWTMQDLFSFLLGHGWGDYNNAAVSNLTLPHDFALYKNGADNASIEFAYRDQVNSHNIFLEYFLALGLLGLALFCFIQYRILSTLRNTYQALGTLFLIILGTLWVFWFQTPHSYTYTTLAFCILFSKSPKKLIPIATLSRYKIPAFMCTVLLGSASIIHLSSAYQYTTSVALKPGDDLFNKIDETLTSPWMIYDHLTGAHRTRQIIAALSADIFAYLELEKNASKEKAVRTILDINAFLTKKIPHGSSQQALSIAMNILSKLATHPKTSAFMQPGSPFQKAWDQTAKLAILFLPNRSDLFVPYFSYLLTTHQLDSVKLFCQDFLERNPQDPIALWYLGTVDLQNDTTYEKGLCGMNQAIHNRIESYIPIPQSQLDQIRQTAQGIQCYRY